MRSDEVIDRIRWSAFLGSATAFPEFSDARMLSEANDRMEVFSHQVVAAREGFWRTEVDVTTTAQGSAFMPARAVIGGLESLSLQIEGSTEFVPLDRVTPQESDTYFTGYVIGRPIGYDVDSERIQLYPTPDAAKTLRLRYYMRPSELVTSQSSTAGGGGVIRGRIDSINAAARTATVNALPYDQLLSTPAAISSGASVDVIRPAGWFTPTVVGETSSISGNVITLAGLTEAQFTDRVQVGMWIRAAGQTDWPPLPVEFHRMLADATAVKILIEVGLSEKAAEVSTTGSGDFERWSTLMSPRVKASPQRIRQRPYWARYR